MPNVIASATTVANGSIKKNNFVIGVDTSIGYGPTSATTFWNGIIPPTSGYTVYAQKSVGGPSIRVANNDSELITIAQQYSGTNINTINDALSYLNSQSNFLVANIDYPSIVTSGMVLNLDAGYVPSYPKTGTTWSDLSGNNNNGTLVNGPTFNSANGGSIFFDGTDDGADIPTNATLQPPNSLTLESAFKISSFTNGLYIIAYGGQVPGSFIKYGFRLQTSGGVAGYMNTNGTIVYYASGINIVLNTWIYATMTYDGTSSKIYINGSLANTAAITGPIDYNAYGSPYSLSIGRKSQFEGGYVSANVSLVNIYNRALSATEVLQNYNAYQSRFVV
jgi:hypothetical protein